MCTCIHTFIHARAPTQIHPAKVFPMRDQPPAVCGTTPLCVCVCKYYSNADPISIYIDWLKFHNWIANIQGSPAKSAPNLWYTCRCAFSIKQNANNNGPKEATTNNQPTTTTTSLGNPIYVFTTSSYAMKTVLKYCMLARVCVCVCKLYKHKHTHTLCDPGSKWYLAWGKQQPSPTASAAQSSTCVCLFFVCVRCSVDKVPFFRHVNSGQPSETTWFTFDRRVCQPAAAAAACRRAKCVRDVLNIGRDLTWNANADAQTLHTIFIALTKPQSFGAAGCPGLVRWIWYSHFITFRTLHRHLSARERANNARAHARTPSQARARHYQQCGSQTTSASPPPRSETTLLYAQTLPPPPPHPLHHTQLRE